MTVSHAQSGRETPLEKLRTLLEKIGRGQAADRDVPQMTPSTGANQQDLLIVRAGALFAMLMFR